MYRMDPDFEDLQRQMEDLQRQNQILRLERELAGFQQALDESSARQPMSTPNEVKYNMPSGPGKVRFTIPPGRSDGEDRTTKEDNGSYLSDDERPDKYVTYRKSKKDTKDVASKTIMKPATFDGTVAWTDYKAHFEACADLNGWSDEQKGLYLSVSLRGQAQGVFGNLGTGRPSYKDLVTALEERFAPPNQTELYRVQLRERRQKASETMAELGQDIRRLINLAYPKAPSDVRETLAKEQFMDALVNSEMRLKQARPVDLNDAVRHAVELEAFYRAENKQLGLGAIQSATTCPQADSSGWREAFSTLQASVDSMTKAMSKLLDQQQNRPYYRPQASRQYSRPPNGSQKGDSQRPSQRPKCFICHSDKHLKRDCPQRKNNVPEKKGQEPSQGKANVCGNFQAGLFIPAKLGDYQVDCLIDTGATLSLVSTKVWDTIKDRGSMDSFDSNIVSASGNKLNTLGKTRVCFEINNTSLAMDVVIAEMDVDVILGLDFMIAHNVKVDVQDMAMNVNGKLSSLKQAGKIGCYRVVVSEQVVVPERSEIILQGKLQGWKEPPGKIGVLEPTESFLTSNKGMVARTLVKAEEQVPVRCANFSNEPQILYPGMNIAEFCPVQVVREDKASKPTSPRNLPSHLTDLYERSAAGMSSAQRKQIANLLRKYGDTFSSSDSDLGRTGIIKHKIPTSDATPIKQPMRRVPVHMQEEVNKQLDMMLENDIIQPSTSPWASGIVLVRKKDGTKRFCIDYRRLNDVTTKDAYPLPRIDESLDQLAGATWFSCLDLSAGYWQVEVDPRDKQKTAFTTRRGLFEYNVMPFGLCNAPATFERLMETVLSGLHWQICLIYLDDIIIYGKTFNEMISNLDTVLQRFEKAGLKLKPQKCQLFQKEVEFLGHVINEHGVNTD